MAKLRRRHLDRLSSQLNDIIDTIVAVRLDIEREAEARALMPAHQTPQLADLERVAALLTGVKVALERMGGTTLPAFREDIQALRAEMVDYAKAHTKTANFIEALHIKHATDNPEPAIKAPKRRPGRPKKDTSRKSIDEPAQEVVEE